MAIRKLARLRRRRLLVFGAVLFALLFTVFHYLIFAPKRYSSHIWSSSISKRSTKSWWAFSSNNQRTKCAVYPVESIAASKRVIDTAEVYPNLDFIVRDGNRHFWNKTFEERYLQTRKTWKNLPLEVIVVPHSHTDPGWLRTIDEYYNAQVWAILNNMVNFLNKTTDFTFIWSEVVFFARWWDSADADLRNAVIQLLRTGQLEIVTGGWVMTDEAVSHYWSIIDQLVEGHQWLKINTKITPKYGWSVDVFGHSSSTARLLKLSNIEGMTTLRTHYALKSLLAYNRELDFYWVHESGPGKIYCHMMPSTLYSFKHTCGPDDRVCLQFDFRRIPGEYSESVATSITEENVRPKAERLLGQYGRYASLYPHNVLLVPLGDDFRYDRPVEWPQQYSNYAKIFKYINDNYKGIATVRFGTLSDYFKTVSKRLENLTNDTLPILKGDLFPYADIYSEGIPAYWTGYFTTRPLYKSLCRELEHWLRTAEILYALVRPFHKQKSLERFNADYKYLIEARQNLALFQHHDAITGTSRESVMEDYGRLLHASIKEAMGIIAHSLQHIVMPQAKANGPFISQIYPDLLRSKTFSLTEKINVVVSNKGRRVIIFNTLTFPRREIVRIRTKTPHIKVVDSDGKTIPSQVNPVWNGTMNMMANTFDTIFVAQVEALSLTTYTLISVTKEDWDSSAGAELSLKFDGHDKLFQTHSAFRFNSKKQLNMELSSPYGTIKFSGEGLPQEIYSFSGGIWQKIRTAFFIYIPDTHQEGAYLFNPRSEIIPLFNFTGIFPISRIVRGPLVTEVTYIQQPFITVTTRIYHFDEAPRMIEMEVLCDLSSFRPGGELAMRINTDINNGDIFYTDSNGYQMMKRRYTRKLHIQGNYYPVTSNAFIEDKNTRLNFFVSHSHGFVSPASGIMEVMIDRKLYYDDNRGLGEGIADNRLFSSKFGLFLEPQLENSHGNKKLSATAHVSSLGLLYPLITLIVDSEDANLIHSKYSFLSTPWPPNRHLVNLRTLPSSTDYFQPSNGNLLIILKKTLCDTFTDYDQLDLPTTFSINTTQISRTSLTGVHLANDTDNYQELNSYRIEFGG